METVLPEDVGFSSDRLARVSELSRRYVDGGKLAGLVTMLARGGKTFHFDAAGAMDTDTGTPMERDAIFRIYSMTKPITSAAVMMLHEEGHFHLDDPVSTFVHELGDLQVCTGVGGTGPTLSSLDRPITIRHLLTHTSGLSYGFFQDTPVDEMYRKSEPRRFDGTLKDMVSRLGELPLVSQPGTRWRYSVATDVLGYLVEVVSEQTFDRFLKERIFEPLGMADTGFHVPEEKLGRLPPVYGPSRENGIAPIETTDVNRYRQPQTLFSGGGGLVSTATDYMRFCQMLLDGGASNGVRILSPKTVGLMTRNHLRPDLMPYTIGERRDTFTQGCGFGLGFKVVMDVAQYGVPGSAGAYSWGGAASTYFWIDPAEQLAAILMAQFMPSSYHPIRSQFETATYQALVG